MNELESTINSILGNPAEMEKLGRLASQLMGGEPPAQNGEAPEEDMLTKLKDVAASMGFGQAQTRAAGSPANKTELLRALSPYLAEKRRVKLEKAIRIARMASLAEAAFRSAGGEDGGV